MDRNRTHNAEHFRQRGAAIVEAVIALPVLLVVVLAAIQFGLIYQAKATLNHASLQAARAGAVNGADPDAIRRGLASGLTPLYSPDSSLSGVASAVARLEAALHRDARIRILNPTREAFADFGTDVDGGREIPNDRLHARSTAIGAQSGVNIQDANLLRVEVTYGFELEVPLVNGFLARTLLSVRRQGTREPFEQQLLRRTLLPITSTATVRMHSPARLSSLVVAAADVPDVDRIAAGGAPPEPDDEADSEGESEPDDDGSTSGPDSDGSSLSEGFFGFGAAGADGDASDESDVEGEIGEDEEAEEGGEDGGTSPPDPPPDAPSCTATTPGTGAAEEQGTLGRVWEHLKALAAGAYELVRGFWDGIKGQIGDLVAAITDPVETARGIYELAVAFMDDPVGTAQAIGAALGQDLSQLVDCGPYDRGRVLGSYVSPAFMLKLATKLAKFGRTDLTRAVAETKRELGCASFGAGTSIWAGKHRLPIETLRTAGEVSSRSEIGYFDREQPITRTFQRAAASYHWLETEASALAVTAEHPFWVQGRGWVAAQDIEFGTPVATANGDTLVLSNTRVDEPLQVFNFSVAGTASYFVGNEGLWAHNATCAVRVQYRRPRSPSNFAVGASDGGAGQWTRISRPDNDAYRYQERITGAPRGVEYNVNGVNFDGYDAERNVLLDAKHWTQECPLGDRCRFEPLKERLAAKLLSEARDQLEATQDMDIPIEWRVVDEEMALRISAILDSGLESSADRSRINVIYTPVSDIVE
jgi:Pretoxin HINT domain/TadE-like protein/Restriction endonuclease fold toxin 5